MLSVLLSVDNPVNNSSFNAPHGDILYPIDPDNQHGSIIDLIPDEEPDNLEVAIADSTTVTIEADNKTLCFGADPSTENIVAVTIDGIVYTLDYSPLQAGEFSFDTETFRVCVCLKQPVNENSLVSYQTQNDFIDIKSTCYCEGMPELLKRWNPLGSIEISDEFEGHSSLSFGFQACKEQVNEVLDVFCAGIIFSGFGNKWRVINCPTITLLKNSNFIAVVVECKDWLAPYSSPSLSPLDQPIRLRNEVNTVTTANNAGGFTGTTNVAFDSSRYISEFAAIAGVRYTGENIRIKSSAVAKPEETITLREILEDYAVTTGGFVFYGAEGVEIRKWGKTRDHVLSECQILSDITFTSQGAGELEDGVATSFSYRNVKADLDFEEEEADQNLGVVKRWTFENCTSLSDLKSPREYYGSYYRAADSNKLRNPGECFDNGGRTKKATETTEYNGTITSQRVIEFGYAFTSKDTYSIANSGDTYVIRKKNVKPNTFWVETKQTFSKYIYDGDGYLKSIITTGKQITRMQQESEKLEAINLLLEAIIQGSASSPDPHKLNQAEAYDFVENLPINDTTNFVLQNHSSHFKDTVKPLASGEVPPKFVHLKQRKSESYIIRENPKNDDNVTYPPLVTGKFLTVTERTTVTNPYHPYKYESYKFSQNNEGEYTKNAIALGSVTQNNGKPGVHTRLDRNKKSGFSSSGSSTGSGNYSNYSNSNFYAQSTNDSSLNTTESVKQYPGVNNPDDWLKAASTELSIENSKSSLTCNPTIHYRSGIQPGDRVIMFGKVWICFGSSRDLDIEYGCFNINNYTLQLGRYLHPEITLENREQNI